jgi:hypothetical protein
MRQLDLFLVNTGQLIASYRLASQKRVALGRQVVVEI